MIVARAVALMTALLALSCRPAVDPATFDARTIQVGSGSVRATYFPPTTPRPGRRDVPLLVVEPILFRRELLLTGPNGGLVPYLESEGFPVWLLWSADPAAASSQTLGRGIVDAVGAIAKQTGARRFDLVGLSLGAEGALRALDPLTAPQSSYEIRRVVFLGAGFDFAYPHSLGSRIAHLRGGPATALCSLDGDVGCTREFRTPGAALPWLGSLPAADPDALAPARDRFSFVTRLTRLPVLFVNGKADGISPSEAMFPLYTLWGSDQPDPRLVPKVLFLAGRENAFGWNFDQLDLLAGDHAQALWNHVSVWLRRDD